MMNSATWRRLVGLTLFIGLLANLAARADGLISTNEGNRPLMKRTQALLAGKQPVRIVFYGDSISEVGRSPTWNGGASAPDKNWGAQLGRRLAEAFPASEITVRHLGIGGQNSYEGLGRIDSLAELKPDLVLVAFGANDCCYHYLLPDETRLALTSLVQSIRERYGADVVIVGTGGDNPAKPFFRHLDETVAAQRQAAADGGVRFVDVRRAILAATENGMRWREFHLAEDNCHPNDNGHRVWADAAMAVLREALAAAGK